MASIEVRDQQRWDFLRRLYDATDATPKLKSENFRVIGEAMGLDEEGATNVAQWLVDRGFAEWHAMGGWISITALGVDQVEDDMRTNAAMATADIASPQDVRDVEAFLYRVAVAVERGELQLDDDAKGELDANRDAIAAHMRSPRPKRSVLRVLLGVVGTVVLGAGGNALYDAAMQLVHRLT
jgi:hypothetical protein